MLGTENAQRMYDMCVFQLIKAVNILCGAALFLLLLKTAGANHSDGKRFWKVDTLLQQLPHETWIGENGSPTLPPSDSRSS